MDAWGLNDLVLELPLVRGARNVFPFMVSTYKIGIVGDCAPAFMLQTLALFQQDIPSTALRTDEADLVYEFKGRHGEDLRFLITCKWFSQDPSIALLPTVRSTHPFLACDLIVWAVPGAAKWHSESVFQVPLVRQWKSEELPFIEAITPNTPIAIVPVHETPLMRTSIMVNVRVSGCGSLLFQC